MLSGEEGAGLVPFVERQWDEYADRWTRAGSVELYPEVRELLMRATCAWAGVPLPERDVASRTRQVSLLFEAAGAVGVRHWQARLARVRSERWLARLVRRLRSGPPAEPSSVASAVAHHRDADGALLSERAAAVELLNVIRPAVAVAVFVTHVAHALAVHPEWRALLQTQHDDALFVAEVRRHYPFFPAATGRVREDFDWQGHRFRAGRRVLLDLYGTDHDPRIWRDPERFDPERFRDHTPDAHEYVPQGGGDAATGHRCPGEPVTVALMHLALDRLSRRLTYRVDPASTEIDDRRLPALPGNGFRITDVAVRSGEATR